MGFMSRLKTSLSVLLPTFIVFIFAEMMIGFRVWNLSPPVTATLRTVSENTVEVQLTPPIPFTGFDWLILFFLIVLLIVAHVVWSCLI